MFTHVEVRDASPNVLHFTLWDRVSRNLESTDKATLPACEYEGSAVSASPGLGFQTSLIFYVGAGGSEFRST